MPFKKIDARLMRTRKKYDHPHVTIGKGRIYFSTEVAEFLGTDTKFAYVLIDDVDQKLGIKPTDENKDGTAYPLISYKNYLGRSINSRNLVKEIKGAAKYNHSEVYKAEWDKAEKMLIVDLRNPLK